MIFTSEYTNLTAPTAGSGKSGFFTLGVAAQEKLYAAEHVPSSPGELGLVFPLLPLPHAAGGILPNFPGMAHSATVRTLHHHTAGIFQTPCNGAVWTTSASGSTRPGGFKMTNWLKLNRKVFYGPKGQQGTKESSHDE